MNAKIINGDKPEKVILSARNDETTSIAAGTPVALKMDATDDGLAVCLPATATATKAGVLAFGVALNAIAAAALGDVQAYGFCRNATIVRATRAASTDVWASTAAGAVGDVLTVDTVNNAFGRAVVTSAYSTGTAASDTKALDLGMFLPMAVLAETIVSATTAASTTSNSNTVSTSNVKVFLRML